MAFGMDVRGLWLLYGPAGVGKTTFCMHVAGEVLSKQKKVVYIDAEQSLDLRRLQEVNRDLSLDIERLLVFRPQTFSDVHAKILGLRDLLGHCGLIIVDTIGGCYRREAADNLPMANDHISLQMRLLSEFSKHVPVIVTNQVGAVIGTNDVRMVGGALVEKWGSTVIELRKDPRRMMFKRPEEKIVPFEITSRGIALVRRS